MWPNVTKYRPQKRVISTRYDQISTAKAQCCTMLPLLNEVIVMDKFHIIIENIEFDWDRSK